MAHRYSSAIPQGLSPEALRQSINKLIDLLNIYASGQYIWVQPDQPQKARTGDVWVDTDNYSRYNVADVPASVEVAVSDDEVLRASGTITITLTLSSQYGCIKKIYNVGSGLVTISATINGESSMVLYPYESVELISVGASGWVH